MLNLIQLSGIDKLQSQTTLDIMHKMTTNKTIHNTKHKNILNTDHTSNLDLWKLPDCGRMKGITRT